MNSSDFLSILPMIVLVAWASILLLLDAFVKKLQPFTAVLAAFGFAASLGIVNRYSASPAYPGFNGMIVADGFASFLNVIFLGSGLIAIALAYDYNQRMGLERGEFYILLMYSVSGMMLMALAADLIVVFLALELLSIPLYVLAGFAQPKPESEESALKYFLLGAFAGGFVVYGIALVYGATGSTNLTDIFFAIGMQTAEMNLLVIGAALILVGFGFKVAVVPFQMWTPDVYQGAPTPVTAFMAIGAKAAGFAALLRIFIAAMAQLSVDLIPVIWALAALTMFIGNFVAIAQSNIKRLLAYSSIAHAGYIFMALVNIGNVTLAKDTIAAALFYLLAYGVTNFGTWAIVISLEKAEGKGLELADFAGLGKKYPVQGAAMLIFMLSFTGIPPTLGFMGKFFLFRTVIEGGFVGLALVGVLTSLVSAYYYLRIVVIMYMKEGDPVLRTEDWLSLTIAGAAVGTVFFAILAVPVFNWVSRAALTLL